MYRLLLFFTFFSITFLLTAQVPAYYNDIDLTLTGQEMLSELSTKVTQTQFTILSYTPGVWETLQQADLDSENANNVLLIYGSDDTDGDIRTDRSRDKNENGGTTGQWNREHVFPRSLGNPNLGSTGPGSDAHHLRASDIGMNSSRSNRKFAAGSGVARVTAQGFFYPGDEWKGDVARMMLFMYLRYNDRCLPSAVGVGNPMTDDQNIVDIFLQWNVEDPVNSFENTRNDVISNIQGNRNPFIDNPAFATTIWGGPQAEDRFGSLPPARELFFSEYIEGSSFHKALEIANFSGSVISLSTYAIRKQTNGAGDWSSGYNLSGTLATGDVFVVANSSAGSGVTSQADITTSSSSLSFNGNDAIGLFKNNSLVDIIGTFNGGSVNFAKDETLRRKPTVASSNSTFAQAEWDIFPQDTFDDLGMHTVSVSSVPLEYCDSRGNNVNFEYIDFVGLNSISSVTAANGGYADFTSQVGGIHYGSNTITLSQGFSGQEYTENWGVWIDFDQNGIFESSEKVVAGSTSNTANLSYEFTVSSSALPGETRMRVAMKWNGIAEPCEKFAYGEVEDYTVNLLSGRGAIDLNLKNDADGFLENESARFELTIIERDNQIQLEMAGDRKVTYSRFNMSRPEDGLGEFYLPYASPSYDGRDILCSGF